MRAESSPRFVPYIPNRIYTHSSGMCSSRRGNSGLADRPGTLLQSRIANYFGLELAGTTFRREVLAGVTTFVTMSYIIAVNPAILKAAGIPEGPSMVATVMTAVVGTLVMGLYANRPFAIAPYMGENAFVAYTVVKVLGYSWQTAMAAVFLAGVMFTLLTVARVRSLDGRSASARPQLQLRRGNRTVPQLSSDSTNPASSRLACQARR